MFKLSIYTILSIFLISSCATLFSGTEETIRIDSEPQDAMVQLNGRNIGKTPTSFVVKRVAIGDVPRIRVSLDGFEDQEFPLSNTFNKTSLWNSSGLYAWTTDVVTGAVMKYSPSDYRVILVEKKKSSFNLDDFDTLVTHYIFTNFEKISDDLSQKKGDHFNGLVEIHSEKFERKAFKSYLLKVNLHEMNYPSDLIKYIKSFKNV